MNYILAKKQKGFTLIEMLLVLVIMSFILLALLGYTQQRTESMRRDRTALQIQQIENASMAYYIANGRWPTDVAELQTAGFLPRGTIQSPYGGQPYILNGTTDTGNLAVCTNIAMGTPALATATSQIISGRIPLGFISDTTVTGSGDCLPTMTESTQCTSNSCAVVSVVNIPGQNINNARSVNFAGVYRHGGCVPAPTCPGPTTGPNAMTPDVVAIPLSVSGLNDPTGAIVYPINSFTAYTKGPIGASPDACDSATGSPPSSLPDCSTSDPPSPSGNYWRVCLQIITEKGDVSKTNQYYGSNVSILAITRCVPKDEPSGSDYTTYQRN